MKYADAVRCLDENYDREGRKTAFCSLLLRLRTLLRAAPRNGTQPSSPVSPARAHTLSRSVAGRASPAIKQGRAQGPGVLFFPCNLMCEQWSREQYRYRTRTACHRGVAMSASSGTRCGGRAYNVHNCQGHIICIPNIWVRIETPEGIANTIVDESDLALYYSHVLRAPRCT